jgi:hypothetical protein
MEKVRARRQGEGLVHIHNSLAKATLHFKDRLDEKVRPEIRHETST